MAPSTFDFPPYVPHPLLAHTYAQTFVGALPRSIPARLEATGVERVFDTVDGNRVLSSCHWQEERHERPTLLLVHGLVGDWTSPYVLGTADKAFARGFNAVRINVRNCGGTEELAPGAYHGGMTDDLRAIGEELAERDGLTRIYVCGFSLGGNMALKLAGELGDDTPEWLRGVATMSPCIDFASSADCLDANLFNRMCQHRFVKGLKRIVRRRKELHQPEISLDGIESIRTVRDFDDRYTAPLAGFRNADDYYERASALPWIPRICVPVLIAAARDDSLVPFESFEREEVTGNPRVTLIAPDRGGHTAFIAREPARSASYADEDRRWGENRLVQYCLDLDARGNGSA